MMDRGYSVELTVREAGGWRTTPFNPLPDRSGAGPPLDRPTVLVQYNPFMYGRWGFAPHLLRYAKQMRGGGSRIVLFVHEPFVPLRSLRLILMGMWQRLQLRVLASTSDVVLTSIEAWSRDLARWHPRRPTHHLPVASNLPDMRHCRAAQRDRLDVGADDIVLATFGTDHPSHLVEHVRRAAAACTRHPGRTVLLELGSRTPRFTDDAATGAVVIHPGIEPAEDLASKLAAADVFMAPFVDGVSTRRTTLMAALQHGIAVVGTDGPLTDTILRRSTRAMALVPVDDVDRFAHTVAGLATRPEERRQRGLAARILYEREFSWDVLAQRVEGFVEGTSTEAARGNRRLPVRVLFTFPWGERLGGAEAFLWTFLRHVDRAAVEPSVAFLQDGPLVAEVTGLGIRTFVVPSTRLRDATTTTATVARLHRLFRRERPDVIVNWMAKTHLYGGTAAALAGMSSRVLWWQHGIPAGHWLDRAATLIPAAAIGCSSEAAAHAQRRLRPRRRTIVVYPGADLPDAPPGPTARADVRAQLNVPNSMAVVGIVGRFEPWKGQDRFLRMIARLKHRGYAVHGLVVGGDAFGLHPRFAQEVHDLADALGLSESVTFTGQTARVPDYLAAMDVFVSASTGEPFGVAIIEAMAAGVPVVAVDDGGPSEILAGEKGGLLAESGEVEALTEPVARLLDDPALRQRLAADGRRRFEAEFTAAKMSERLQAELCDFADAQSLRARQSWR
jgi:glycosyltransferase involved in cell wall biosynthesis